MNIPKGYKLVPEVATLAMKNAGWRECERQGYEPEEIEMQTVWTAMHLEAPAPPQPIFDEAPSRKLFEQIISKRGWSTEKIDGFYSEPYAQFAWSICLEFAQSRAKAGKVGHE